MLAGARYIMSSCIHPSVCPSVTSRRTVSLRRPTFSLTLVSQYAGAWQCNGRVPVRPSVRPVERRLPIAAAGARAEDIDRQLPAPRIPYIGPYLQTPELRLRVASC